MGSQPRIAVLVDADNVTGDQISFAVSRAGKYGAIALKRAFGRVTSITGKADSLTKHGFTAEVIFPPQGNGKNAADLLLAQYATRLAERRVVEAIALVSSDGDFAPIAAGLSEAGIHTIGFGRQDTPVALQDACAAFVLFPSAASVARASSPQKAISYGDRVKLIKVIENAMESGRVRLSTLGTKLISGFGANYRSHFGVTTISELVAPLDGFEIDGEGSAKEWVIRTRTAQVVSLPARPAASG